MRWYRDIIDISEEFGLKWAYRIRLKPSLHYLLYKNDSQLTRNNEMLLFLSDLFKEEISKLRNIETIDDDTLSINTKIWICWWQGKDEMPPTIKRCVDSIVCHHKDCTITIIDKNNFLSYVEIPEYVLDKVEKSSITLTQFSDILRCALLYKYGGVWLDAALFCTSHGDWAGQKFFSPKMHYNNGSYISGFKWVPGCIGAIQGFPLFGFAYECFIKYWKKYSYLVDFLLVDYIFELAYRNNNCIKRVIDANSFNNEDLHRSRYLFNDKCDPQVYHELIENNQFLSLTWRIPYRTHDENGQLTYYGQLLKDFDNPQ